MPRSLTALLLLIYAGCAQKDAAEPPAPAPAPASAAGPAIESASFAPALGVDLAASTKTPTGVYYRDLTIGTGTVVAAGQQVAVHYDGTLADGTRFDQNGPGDQPFSFKVGNREVIDGWDAGVVGMRVGGKRQLIIPPALGYGPNTYGPIPGNSILVFTVEVVSAQ